MSINSSFNILDRLVHVAILRLWLRWKGADIVLGHLPALEQRLQQAPAAWTDQHADRRGVPEAIPAQRLPRSLSLGRY